MLLPDFILSSRANQEWFFSGLDAIENCLDKTHFQTYPYQVKYTYNSRGFRDEEWPSDTYQLKKAVWCIGDSFTEGLGSPLEHTWVYQLGKQLNKKTINVSMDGASNHWITRKVLRICECISPELIVIQWSYTHRSELDDVNLNDESRRLHTSKLPVAKDVKNFIDLIDKVESNKDKTRIIHSFIPKYTAFPDVVKLACKHMDIDFIPEIVPLDLARDGHHYDILTAEKFSQTVCDLLNNRGI